MQKRTLIIDVETTGLSPTDGHRIIEFCALEVIDNKLTGNKLHLFFNPERDIPKEATKIHGITLKHLKDKPTFKECIEQISKFIFSHEDYVIWVMHNAKFDYSFIKHELALCGKTYEFLKPNETNCTLRLSRKIYLEKENKHSLDALCDRFKINRAKRITHSALLDCELLFKVWRALQEKHKISFDKKSHDIDLKKEPFLTNRDLRIFETSKIKGF